MLYRKNLPTWERWGRGLIGIGLVVLGVTAQWATLTGWVLVGLGTITLSSGFVGFCPMCALVGRKLKGRLHRARGLIREYLTGQPHAARLAHGDER